MKRTSLIVVFLALLAASGFFPGAHTASANELTYELGTAIDPLPLPDDATLQQLGGGTPPYTISVSGLPAGVSFDEATRIISGTPSEVGTTVVTITVTDANGASAPLPAFTIEVNAPDTSALGVLTYEVGTAIDPLPLPDDATLQQLGGGTPPYTISVSGLPAGVSFDEATRIISGTPSEVGTTIVIVTITDANGASASLPPFNTEVVLPPLGAPNILLAQDYKGADGQGDQGGFLLLTWPLSEDHDTLDGYRIFREIPSLNNEMIPWAMVDAVPGVQLGRTIVATLDNVATRWGIAAERDGRTTLVVTAKAAFVSAENQPYEQMAETLMASMEAAQAGDAPVFASLLPEALAYAQGVAPKLQQVEGVLQQSEITVTDEPVRAIDNIAPEAVPALSALDAPNDEGSRIVLTWTLSPSDQVLQGVVAGAVGPAAAEPVVGVHGYSIYRRAVGEDEFAMIAQVKRGVTSFVDETALHGVRYTYQVRPYDLDNETGSDIEHTAMAVRNIAVDSEGRTIFGLFGADNRIGFDDFFIFADNFGLTAEDTGFDPAFDLSPNATIDFEDFFVFADNFGRSTAAAGKRVPMFAGLNDGARMYLDARTAMPIVGEDFVLDVSLADFAAIKGYGLQVQYEADKLEFVQVLTDQPLGGSALAAPQVLSDEGGVLALVAHGDVVSEGEVALSLVFRPTTEIENTLIEIADNQTYDSEFGFNRLA
ncbi:MAG: Ig domain-containing protein, partial [Gemmatimonadota bacterium]|nr:Ig domain-containing protein [Gemmatimonadota bacterium]